MAVVFATEVDQPMNDKRIVAGSAGPVEVCVHGAGRGVVLVASLGRGADDFADLGARLAASGYCGLALEPRGVGGSMGPLEGMTMADLADDVAAVIRALAGGRATIVGHAFGNRVARMVAARHPELVEGVVLLACGGLVPPSAEVSVAMTAVFDTSLDRAARQEAMARAFFAPGNDASVWEEGWHPKTAVAQIVATTSTPVEEWWTAGSADVLVVQPECDVVAVAENAAKVVEMLGGRASLVTIQGAGHALLPEQPEAVAAAVLSWLGRRPSGSTPSGVSGHF